MGAWLREELEALGYGFAGEPRGGNGTGEMVAVFYRKVRFELLHMGHFWLSEDPHVPGTVSTPVSTSFPTTIGFPGMVLSDCLG